MIKLDQYVSLPNGIRLHYASVGEPGKSLVLFVVRGFPLFDVQCFDLRAVDSYRRNPAHQAMSASMYANPHSRGAVCNLLDATW